MLHILYCHTAVREQPRRPGQNCIFSLSEMPCENQLVNKPAIAHCLALRCRPSLLGKQRASTLTGESAHSRLVLIPQIQNYCSALIKHPMFIHFMQPCWLVALLTRALGFLEAASPQAVFSQVLPSLPCTVPRPSWMRKPWASAIRMPWRMAQACAVASCE